MIGDIVSGTGDKARAHVLVKPIAKNLKTNLVIITDRRAYHLELTSTNETYMASVSWAYPHDQLIALQRPNAIAEEAVEQIVDRGLRIDNLQFRYAISGDNPPWRPVRVFDDTNKPTSFKLDDCTTQRNLDARGREQARKIGAAIRAAGATVDRVVTSQWCRCRDTARFLDLGPVEDLPALNSFFRNRDRAGPQTAELRQFLLGLQPGETVILVTHQVNITALTGRIPASGEVFLLEIGRDGTISVVDVILIGPWR